MKEIWKDIPKYEELYQISNLGKAIHNGKKCNGYYWKYKEE